MPERKVHAAVRAGTRWAALCRHINRPILADRRRDVTCEVCLARLSTRSGRRYWRALRRG